MTSIFYFRDFDHSHCGATYANLRPDLRHNSRCDLPSREDADEDYQVAEVVKVTRRSVTRLEVMHWSRDRYGEPSDVSALAPVGLTVQSRNQDCDSAFSNRHRLIGS